jgi:hypothetical protein
MRLDGQTFSTEILERIRTVVSAEDGLSRSALSRRVCGWLGWRDASGKPKEVSSRKALVELERRGVISLPAARCPAPQAREVAALEPFAGPVFSGSLVALGGVELVAVDDPQRSALWRRMLASHHPQGGGPLCGAQQRYLIRSPVVGWLGALGFSAAAWQLAARDEWIGWCAYARSAQLGRVVANSRFLILPSIEVANLGSHVLALAARQLPLDWSQRYGEAPVLLETFVDESRFAGTVYKAANWQRLGETSGRGRQDRHNRAALAVKAIYVLPLQPEWRTLLCRRPAPVLRLPPPATLDASVDAGGDTGWAEQEFGRVDFPDARLRPRLLSLAAAFAAQPTAPIPVALQGNASDTKAAYRFFNNPQVDLQTLLQPHFEATAARIAEQPVVLTAQDTTSLNYDAHPATRDLGPINTHADGAQGLKLHDTLALTPEGVPLGLVDIQVWARDAQQTDQAAQRKQRPIEDKESQRGLDSFRRTAAFQRLCPDTRLVSVADREADIYELFQEATQDPDGPDLLVRANRATQRRVDDDNEQTPLWNYLPTRPLLGHCDLAIPGRGGRKARVATLEIRCAAIQLHPPKRLKGAPALALWAVHAIEPKPPAGAEAVEWLLLTTVATVTLEDALERLRWYAVRWNIEIYQPCCLRKKLNACCRRRRWRRYRGSWPSAAVLGVAHGDAQARRRRPKSATAVSRHAEPGGPAASPCAAS